MSNKRKRHVLTMEQKIEILSKLDKGETSVSLANLYNIGKATVTDIKITVMQSWILRQRWIMVME